MNTPVASLEFRLERTPASAGTDTYRWSTRALPDETFIEGRIPVGGWREVSRALSSEQGDHSVSRASVELMDNDGLLRGLLDGVQTQFFENREATVKLHSEVGRPTGIARNIFRGAVTDAQVSSADVDGGRALRATIDLEDALRPHLDKLIPSALFDPAHFPGIDPRLAFTPIPIIAGEHSDDGALDDFGVAAAKGMCPAIHVGMRRTVDDNPLEGIPAYLAAPVLTARLTGAGGSTPYTYGVTAHSAFGQTILSNVVTILGPATLTPTDGIELTWTVPTGDVTGYSAYGRVNPTPVRRLASFGADTTTYTDDGSAVEQPGPPPSVNTAQIPGTDGAFFWDFYVLCLGASEIIALYGSSSPSTPGVAPERIDITATAGVDVLMPGHPGWPHAQLYLDIGPYRVTGFYARGPRSNDHIQGVVTFAAQMCGAEDIGDGTGDSIQEAFPMLQWFLNEHVFKNQGEGYRSGLYGPVEAFSNGDPMLQTSKFTDAQALTAQWMGTDEGYYGAIYLGGPNGRITVREFLRGWNLTHGCFTATNHHGQLYPVLINDEASSTDGRVYRRTLEIKALGQPQIDRDQIEPKMSFQFDWDPDAQAYRSEIIPIADEAAFDAQKGRTRDQGVQLSPYTRDFATAHDARSRRLRRLKYARRLQPLVTNYYGLSDELGDQIRIGHKDQIGDSTDTLRPHIVIGHRVDLNRGEVTLVGLDVSRLLETAFGALEDEATMSANLGDETSSAAPPTGAFELT